ncbi:hypothetical protein LENED_011368 [Lentinula edodes]|uniref:Uncharacterized protein n=1 Tax=Lentinula edodes TaxID=5353 RepID=A0A1Q3EPW7_LENED|nr:hypothetical protein LENED_011368 [Lentinula edodes]
MKHDIMSIRILGLKVVFKKSDMRMKSRITHHPLFKRLCLVLLYQYVLVPQPSVSTTSRVQCRSCKIMALPEILR